MNEFLEQFLIESREHVEQATADLLALERTPADNAHVDSVFRAFHTLKGGAGIVDFTAMAHAVHAAEDELSAARAGTLAITTSMIGDCLACLDQVAQWLDTIESTGELPEDPAGEADRIVARFDRSSTVQAGATLPVSASQPEDWLDALLSRHESVRQRAHTAVRYAPDPACFYSGTDPCARIAAVPGLLALRIEPASAWPSLEALDPFACNVVLTALTETSRIEVTTALADVIDDCEVVAIGDAASSSDVCHLPAPAGELLEAQIALIDAIGGHGAAGRLASAGLVAANVLRHARRTAEAEQLARTTEVSVAANNPRLLRAAIEAVLSRSPAGESPSSPAPVDHEVSARTLRVEASRIDALVNLTGELTVAKNSIGHATLLAQEGDPALASIFKQRYAVLDHLVGELQRSVLSMRVLPLRHVFQRFPRLLREISRDLGKPAQLSIEGGETEADKAIVEMLFEPLLHVLRNAIDHGVVVPWSRSGRRKPPTATIRLSAHRQSEHVIVEVADDGQGIDVARVRRVASERKLFADDIVAALSDDELIDLIFEPGFSTATEVTGLSGRGVGMDAVRHAVERFGGSVSVGSRPGEGTTVRFTLPFSVMMTRVVLVGAGERVFGIPLDVVVETLRVAADSIAKIGAAHAIVLRNRTVPLVSLAEAVGLASDELAAGEATIVVVKAEGHYGALRVDRIGERMEVMLKPLDGLLAGMRGLAGSTLLGDGSVLLVLDVGELLQ
jgi:two-component system chemotaxis sensor kinase CheA